MKRTFLNIISFIFIFSAQAQTFGELYYEQLSGLDDAPQLIRIHLKLVRLCSLNSEGISSGTINIIDRQSNTMSSANLTIDSFRQMTREIDPCIVASSSNCYTIFYFHTDIKNTFTGIFGFVTYSDCCRNSQNLVFDKTTQGATSIFYSIKIPAPSQHIHNSNAYFTNDTILNSCLGKSFMYNEKAFDPDGDSLVYSFARALQSSDIPPFPPYFYTPPFDTFPPLGSQVKIDSKTGSITGIVNQAGNFLITVQADEYRNGTLISSHTKDIPINVYDCLQLPKPRALLPDIINDCSSFTQNFPNNSNPLTSYFLWGFGDGSSSTDIFPQHTYNDTGSYTVKLSVNKGYTCADSAFSKVLIYPTLKSMFTHQDSCSDLPVTFYSTSTSTYGMINSYKWIFQIDNNINDTVITSSATRYSFAKGEKSYLVKLQVSNTKGCMSLDSQYVNVYSTPSPLPVHDTTIAFGYNYQIKPDSGGVNGYSDFRWSPTVGLSNPFIFNPVVSYNQNITYRVSIRSPFNCTRNDSIHIIYFKGPDIYVPSAFTPNNDGLNDMFNIKLVGMKSLDFFIIYNRLGQHVFEERNKNTKGWNGIVNGYLATAGVYIWVIKATDVNNKPFIKKGTVVLLR